MKEQFRGKTIREKISITLKMEDGNYRWKASSYQILAMCRKITEEYLQMGIKITLRQLYYDLVSENIIPNHDTVYKKISKLLTDARYLGLIDWDAIEDRNRPSVMHIDWDNPHDALTTLIAQYRLPRWEDQKYYLEVFTEKDALSSIIEPICDKYHIRFNVNKGYSSASIMYKLSKRIAKKIDEGKEVILLYVGDFDPSGLDMVRDIDDRITEFLENGETYYNSYKFSIHHVALTLEQINERNPPPNPAKIKDPRAKWYIAKYGKKSYEVEALKPQYLINKIEEAIHQYIENDKYIKYLDKEKKQKEDMKNFADKYREGDKNE